jgi:short-subunit dehydrogenase
MQGRTQNKQSSSLRKSIFYFIIALFVLVFAIFIRSDADLGLFLAREKPEKAFKDKVVWVLGASSGIGAQAAVDFAKDGAKVIVSARREDKLNEVSAKCVAAGGEKAFILPLDMTDLSSHKQAFEQVKAKYGHVDILLLNAGVGLRTTANLTDFATTEELFKLNFFSFISMTKEVLPSMISRKSGKVTVFVFAVFYSLFSLLFVLDCYY